MGQGRTDYILEVFLISVRMWELFAGFFIFPHFGHVLEKMNLNFGSHPYSDSGYGSDSLALAEVFIFSSKVLVTNVLFHGELQTLFVTPGPVGTFYATLAPNTNALTLLLTRVHKA